MCLCKHACEAENKKQRDKTSPVSEDLILPHHLTRLRNFMRERERGREREREKGNQILETL